MFHYERWDESIEALVEVPSLSKLSKEIQTTPPPTPPRMVDQGIDTWELEMNLRGLNVSTDRSGFGGKG